MIPCDAVWPCKRTKSNSHVATVRTWLSSWKLLVPLKQIEYGVYRDLITIYSKPYSIYLRGTIVLINL